ncbi:MAG TPA: glycoside hydrolase family 125 protein [Candidatus Eisenbergiella merdigallinarum]|uniref:Glycoside hydrolase family 125 protein n=1 Tax=Candidatus Eisenbergiella merdigallinarum TaxID=2838552 RepID=A0A9D2SEN2_9FIRM|nr:glycoside hydrolase family 125 protein [Candidatus Eisenbergiella merdigallinarum]
MTEKQVLQLVKEKMAHRPKIVAMFENCYQDTLEKTVHLHPEDGTAFMLTGDIPAMWLRDSTNQLRPYLLVASENERVAGIIEGVMKKQFQCILRDPYANAFNEEENGAGHQKDLTEMKADIWERKYEIDSLCYPVQLAYLYWKNTGRTAQFDGLFLQAARAIVELWKTEQRHGEQSPYTFERLDCVETDTLPCGGKGNPVSFTGMTWSGFRPSDDRCVYGYLVPSNMFAVVVLDYLAEILETFYQEDAFLAEAKELREQIQNGIETFGTMETEEYGRVYVYEVDGRGNRHIMDDANVPSLLSMPYFHYCKNTDQTYLNTRRMMLSDANPYYYEGKVAKGIGSPHTPEDYIWHIALSIQGMTSADAQEKERLLDYFERTDAGTNLVHEGFHKDDPDRFTREWFSWSNAMFVEFVLSMCGLTVKAGDGACAD